MTLKTLDDRRQALENEFFSRKNREALDEMRAQNAAKTRRASLVEASHISDEDVIAALDEAGISPETLTAVSVIPLVVVAWADGSIKPAERAAIQKAAAEAGLTVPGSDLLEGWLAERPSTALLDTWKAYVHGLHSNLSGEAYTALRDQVLGSARAVAAAAGGFLGLGAISAAETNILDALHQAFVDG